MSDTDQAPIADCDHRRSQEAPLNTNIVVIKIASRCNLACTYCYMYQHADQSWRQQPRFMSNDTIRRLAARLKEHAERIQPERILVVLHGGEPLLFPNLEYLLEQIREAVTASRVQFAIQTNGTLLDEDNVSILRRFGVRIGVSIDGGREAHNRARIDHKGGGSYDSVVAGLQLAKRRAPEIVSSVLQVIDPSVPPSEALDELEGFGVPRADLLLPYVNHDSAASLGHSPGVIGAWLCAVFDQWVERSATVDIRIFTLIIGLLMGRKKGTDQWGARADGALMIETDGSYHVYDALKSAFPGASVTGMSCAESSIGDFESLAFVQAFREKALGACRECIECRLFSVCGGGSPIHRFGTARGFDQPSVYCHDITTLIDHIGAFVRRIRPDARLVC